MNQVTIQWDVVIAIYIFFNWCHGGIVFLVPIAFFYLKKMLSGYCFQGTILESLKNQKLDWEKLYAHKYYME